MPKPPQQNNPDIEALFFRAAFEPETFDPEKQTVEVIFSTGQGVRRYDYENGVYFNEVLEISTKAIDFSRLGNGAPVLNNHSRYELNDVIGVVEKAWVDKGVAKALLRFSERDDVKPIVQDVKGGILRAISVGYSVQKYQVEQRDGDIPVYTATRWTPAEISLVTIPADAGASVRSNQNPNPIKETPMPEPTPQPTQRTEPAPAPTAPPVDIEAARAQAEQAGIEKERQRIADIQLSVRSAKLPDDFAQKMIADGVSADQCRKAVLEEMVRLDKTYPPFQTGGGADIQMGDSNKEKLRTAATDAILYRQGLLSPKEKEEKLHGNPFVGRSAREIARDCLENNGENVRGLSDNEIVKRAFTSSTSDFPVILENVLHRTVVSSYLTVGETWRRFCTTGNVTDFREWKRLKLASIGTLDPLNELGEFKNKALKDAEAESIKIKTFGNIVNISRQMIVNDDLGAFLGISAQLGRAAALTIEKAVYEMLLSNPVMSDGKTLFHADHGNLSATGSALSVIGLDANRVAMAQQMDVGGNDFLDVSPTVLLVPKSLGGTAKVINRSEYDPDTANKLQRANMVFGLFNDIVDTARLSGTARYLFADPAIMPALEVAFLNGNDTPYLEQENGFTVDGVSYKVRIDFGVAAIEHRAVYKDLGA